MQELSKKVLGINIILSQIIIILISLLLLKLFDREFDPAGSLLVSSYSRVILGVIIGSTVLLSVQFIFIKFVSKEKLLDEINVLLIEKFTLPELFLIFFFGALSEEILFRGILQPQIGIWLTSLLFVIIHVRYLRKIFILIEVYIMSLILGFLYAFTSVLWVPIFCHFIVNCTMAILIKKGKITYHSPE